MRSVACGNASFSPCFMMPFDDKGLNGSNPKHQINNSSKQFIGLNDERGGAECRPPTNLLRAPIGRQY